MTKRIWELDALRGICVLGMVTVHGIYDAVTLYRLVSWQPGNLFTFVMNWGGVLFLLISGICATLSNRTILRGLTVLGCGLLCTAVTGVMYLLGFSGREMIIWFGVLHCLGLCMILWPAFRNCPAWLLLGLGISIAMIGQYFLEYVRLSHDFFAPFGLTSRAFSSGDYFPLLPNFGFFLMGSAAGKVFYKEKRTLFPQVSAARPVLAFVQLCGRMSLPIYLLHQPVLSLIFSVIASIAK